MSGIQQMLVGSSASSSGPTSVFNGAESVHTDSGIKPVTASLAFNSDGSVTAGGSFYGSTGHTTDWYLVNTTGIGSSYWIKGTKISESPVGALTMTGGSFTTWVSLASGVTFRCFCDIGGMASGGIGIQIASDSGGVTVVASGTINLEADS